MLFVEPRYLLFFLVVFSVYWALRASATRKWVLLVSSYAFYAAWDWRFLGLIVFSTVLDHAVALRIEQSSAVRARRAWLSLSLLGNLGVLACFKYFDFFAASAARLAAHFGIELSAVTLDLVLPVGISFYTFQTLSYTLDVHRGLLRAERSLLNVAVFVAFFPQLVAGPIVRARDFLPQLHRPIGFEAVDVRGALVLFGIGFFKKAVLADHVAPVVDTCFADPARYEASAHVLATALYSLQIYCDFSGYSDMAIGSAALLGFRLPVNFARPYLATGLREFWRRWHISLSSWLRDYLYVPLGGNRGGRWRTTRNLLMTMLLGGLWHGAGWNFVVWGGGHGLGLVGQREFRRVRGADRGGSVRQAGSSHRVRATLLVLLSWSFTLWFVGATWIFFRATSFTDAFEVLRSWCGASAPGRRELPLEWWWLVAGAFALHVVAARCSWMPRLRAMPDLAFAISVGLGGAVLWAFAPLEERAFVYFQF